MLWTLLRSSLHLNLALQSLRGGKLPSNQGWRQINIKLAEAAHFSKPLRCEMLFLVKQHCVRAEYKNAVPNRLELKPGHGTVESST